MAEETAVISAETLHHKVLCGYQGWFRCPGDGTREGWLHWSRNRNKLTTDSLTVEMWPDVSEYGEQDVSNENPYEAPRPISEPLVKTPPRQHGARALTTSVRYLLFVVLMSLYWYREFGGAGLTMLIGGFTGSFFGWWIAKERWWGMAGGAVVGFTSGAAFGIAWLFSGDAIPALGCGRER